MMDRANGRIRDPRWDEAILTIVADNPEWRGGRIRDQLVAGLTAGKLTITGSPPAHKTINALIDSVPITDLQDRLPARWPDNFGTPDFPWEAAPYLFEVMRHSESLGLPRPTVRLAKWFWRVSMAVPGANLLKRHALATQCSEAERAGKLTGDKRLTVADLLLLNGGE